MQTLFDKIPLDKMNTSMTINAPAPWLLALYIATAEKQRVVTVAEGARKAQETRGMGDSQAIQIYANAFGRDPEFFSFYRSMEAYKKICDYKTYN